MVRFFDAATGGETRDPLEAVGAPMIFSMDISDDGRYLATAIRGDPNIGPAYETIWDLDAPASPPRRLDYGIDAPWVAFTPNGHLVIASLGMFPGVGLTVIDPATSAVLLTDPTRTGRWPSAPTA